MRKLFSALLLLTLFSIIPLSAQTSYELTIVYNPEYGGVFDGGIGGTLVDSNDSISVTENTTRELYFDETLGVSNTFQYWFYYAGGEKVTITNEATLHFDMPSRNVTLYAKSVYGFEGEGQYLGYENIMSSTPTEIDNHDIFERDKVWSMTLTINDTVIRSDEFMLAGYRERIQGAYYVLERYNGSTEEFEDFLFLTHDYTNHYTPGTLIMFARQNTTWPKDVEIFIPQEATIEYTQFQSPGEATTAISDPLPSGAFGTVLTYAGLWNTPGLLFLYTIILLLTVLGLVFIKAPGIVSIFAIISITGIFISTGWLPIWASFIIIAFMGLAFMMMFKGGLGVE